MSNKSNKLFDLMAQGAIGIVTVAFEKFVMSKSKSDKKEAEKIAYLQEQLRYYKRVTGQYDLFTAMMVQNMVESGVGQEEIYSFISDLETFVYQD